MSTTDYSINPQAAAFVRPRGAARRIARLLFWCFLIPTLVLCALQAGVWKLQRTQNGPFPVERAGGQAYLLSIEYTGRLRCCLIVRGDEAGRPQSDMRVWINGQELEPPHASHEAIRNGEKGFSHWEVILVFGLPPGVANTADTQLTYVVSRKPAGYLLVVAVLGALVSGFLGYRSHVAAAATRVRAAVPRLLARSAVVAGVRVDPRKVAKLLFWCFLAGTILGCALQAGIWKVQQTQNGPFELESPGQQAYVVSAEYTGPLRCCLSLRGDEMGFPQSDMRAWLNGRELGPPHTPHGPIRNGETTGFSHWYTTLVFTLPSGLANTSEAQLTYVVSLRPTGYAFASVVLGTLIFWILAYRPHVSGIPSRLRHVIASAVIVASIVWANVAIYGLTQWLLLIAPDSFSMLVSPELRGAAIQGFFRGILKLNPDASLVVPIQLNLMLAAFVLLGWAISRVTRSTLAGAVAALLLIWNDAVTQNAVLLMSEGVFCAVLAAHLALVLLFIDSRRRAVLAGGSVALAAGLRPVGYAIFPGAALAVWFNRRKNWRTSVLFVGAIALVMLANSVANRIQRSFTDSYAGYAVLGYTMHLLTPSTPTAYPELRDRLLASMAGVAPSPDLPFPTAYYEAVARTADQLLWVIADNEITRYRQERRIATGNGEMALDIARGIISQQPWGYARLVAANFYAMGTLVFAPSGPSSVTLRNSADYLQQVDDQSREGISPYIQSFEKRKTREILQAIPTTMSFYETVSAAARAQLRWTLPIALVGSLICLGWALLASLRAAPPPLLQSVAVLGLSAWCYPLAVAMSAPAGGRFALVEEVILVPLVVLLCVGALRLAPYGLALLTGGENWRSARTRSSDTPTGISPVPEPTR